MANEIVIDEAGSWPEYRRYVVNQLKDTSSAINQIKNMLDEQKIKMTALDAHLGHLLDGSIERRIDLIEKTLNWAKGIGTIFGLGWSVFLIWVSHFFK